jgi:hypothetical protein
MLDGEVRGGVRGRGMLEWEGPRLLDLTRRG